MNGGSADLLQATLRGEPGVQQTAGPPSLQPNSSRWIWCRFDFKPWLDALGLEPASQTSFRATPGGLLGGKPGDPSLCPLSVAIKKRLNHLNHLNRLNRLKRLNSGANWEICESPVRALVQTCGCRQGFMLKFSGLLHKGGTAGRKSFSQMPAATGLIQQTYERKNLCVHSVQRCGAGRAFGISLWQAENHGDTAAESDSK